MPSLPFIIVATLQVLATPVSAYMSPDEIFDVPPGAQSSSTAEPTPEEEQRKTEIRERIFYRNGETKAIGSEAEQPSSEAAIAEPVVSEPVTEPIVSDPVIMEEEAAASSASSEEQSAPVTKETAEQPAPVAEEPRGVSTGMIASAAIVAVIVIGGLLFLLRMFLRRFKPTISKEAIAPPPVAQTAEPSLPHLEAALGIKKDEPPAV